MTQERNENEKPEEIKHDRYGVSNKGTSSDLNIQKVILISLVVAIVAALGAIQFMVMPTLNKVVTQANIDASVKVAQTTLQADINKVNSTVTSLQNQVGGLTPQITNATTLVNQISGQVGKYATQDSIGQMNSSISSLQTALNTIKATADTALSQSNTDKTAITSLQASIDALSIKVNNLSTTVTTPAGTISTSNISGVGIIIPVTNTWTNSTTLGFPTTNVTQTQSFQFQIVNNSGKFINNVQLAVGFQVLDANNYTLTNGLPNATFTLSSAGLATIWNPQSTGYPYLVGFTNTATTGMFGGIGVLSQNPGTTSYTLTVTVTPTSGGVLPTFYLYPIIKVIGYTN